LQSIDDEFLERFVKNPTCDYVETKLVEFEVDLGLGDSCVEHGSFYKIIIPKEDDDLPTTTSDLIDGAIWDLPFDDRMKVWDLIEKLVKEETSTLYTEEQLKIVYTRGYDRGIDRKPRNMEAYIEFIKQNKKD